METYVENALHLNAIVSFELIYAFLKGGDRSKQAIFFVPGESAKNRRQNQGKPGNLRTHKEHLGTPGRYFLLPIFLLDIFTDHRKANRTKKGGTRSSDYF